MASKVPLPTPQRTREHVIADLSINHVERFILEQGHVADQDTTDYGYDIIVKTFDEHGYAEPGFIFLQVKATDAIGDYELAQQQVFAFGIERKHYHLWTAEPMPVFFVLFGTRRRKAYWLHIQDYFQEHPPAQVIEVPEGGHVDPHSH